MDLTGHGSGLAPTDNVPAVGQVEQPQFRVEPVLANYMDFRRYLSDWYAFRRYQTRKDLRPYSFAMFSAAADIKSPNYLKLIIEGRRNLSDEMIGKFAKACGLNKDLTEEFRLLVLFGQASEPSERNVHLKMLSELRMRAQLKSGEIDRRAWEKIPNWIGWILYAALDQANVKFTASGLRDLLRGKAADTEIDEALRSLVRSGEVTQNDITGQLEKAHQLIEAPDEIPVALVRRLQSQLMYLGLESLFQDSPAEREFGSLTLSLTKAEFEELRFRLRQMRKQTHKDNATKRQTSKGDRVYQLNLQLFPVTDPAQSAE